MCDDGVSTSFYVRAKLGLAVLLEAEYMLGQDLTWREHSIYTFHHQNVIHKRGQIIHHEDHDLLVQVPKWEAIHHTPTSFFIKRTPHSISATC